MPAAAAPSPADCRVRQPRADKLDTRSDRRVAELAADAWGVLSLDELRACGLTRDGVMVRVRNGWLHRLHRGVYAVGHPNVPLKGRFLAAIKACGPTAVLSHFSAAVLYALLRWDDRYPEVTVPGTTTKAAPGHLCPPLLDARFSRHHAPLRHPDNHPGPNPHRPRRFLRVPSAPTHGPPGTEPPHQRPADPERRSTASVPAGAPRTSRRSWPPAPRRPAASSRTPCST